MSRSSWIFFNVILLSCSIFFIKSSENISALHPKSEKLLRYLHAGSMQEWYETRIYTMHPNGSKFSLFHMKIFFAKSRYLGLGWLITSQFSVRCSYFSMPKIHTSDTPSPGVGLLRHFPPFRYFQIFSALSKHTLAIEYHVYIWQVLQQLSCGDTCHIWMWFN